MSASLTYTVSEAYPDLPAQVARARFQRAFRIVVDTSRLMASLGVAAEEAGRAMARFGVIVDEAQRLPSVPRDPSLDAAFKHRRVVISTR